MKQVFILSCIVFLGGCMVIPQRETPGPTDNRPVTETGTAARTPEQKGPDDLSSLFDNVSFSQLEPEIKTYLTELADAFINARTEFLLSQGEADYHQRNYPLFEHDEYLALLYRIGPYATEKPDSLNKLPVLDTKTVQSITYTGWDERGPLIEVRGILQLKDGQDIPCKLLLLWKLEDIRILGQEP